MFVITTKYASITKYSCKCRFDCIAIIRLYRRLIDNRRYYTVLAKAGYGHQNNAVESIEATQKVNPNGEAEPF